MRKDLKVSIVVIGYNISEYVRTCLDSIFKNEYDNYEVIFVDDGSTDETAVIAEEYRDRPNFVLVRKPNGGCVSARKAGLAVASGDYVGFVDGDDWINENYIDNLIGSVENEDIVYSNFYAQQKNGSFRIVKYKDVERGELAYFKDVMLDKMPHFMFAKLFKREFLERCNYPSFPDISMGEDLYSNAVFGLANPSVLFSKTINYYYRFNRNSLTQKAGDHILKQVETLELLKDYLERQRLFDGLSEYYYYQWYSFLCAYFSYRSRWSTCLKLKKEYRKRIKHEADHPFIKTAVGKMRRDFRILLKFPFLFPLLKFAYCVFRGTKILIRKAQTDLWKVRRKHYFAKQTSLLNINHQGRNLFLIGTSDRSNIGDHAIAQAETRFFQRFFPDENVVEITGDHYRLQAPAIKKLIQKDDILFITGGGFLGDLWMDEERMVRDVISSFPDNLIIVLPQTIYFIDKFGEHNEYVNSRRVYGAHKKLFIFARDKKSYDILSEMIGHDRTALFPDMALYLNNCPVVPRDQKLALLCLRKDRESCLKTEVANELRKHLIELGFVIRETSTLDPRGDILLKDRDQRIAEKLNEFAGAGLLVTDRLHGMLLAKAVCTPVVALDNESKKVSGVYNAFLRNISFVKCVSDTSNITEAVNSVLAAPALNYCFEKEAKAFAARVDAIMKGTKNE